MGSGKGKARRAQSKVAEPEALVDDGRGLPFTPSGASEGARETYMTGFGHVFALALHSLYGWQLRGVFSGLADEYSIKPFREFGGAPRQIYCLNDNGFPVDVNGVFESEAAIRRFYAHPHAHDEELISGDINESDLTGRLIDEGYPSIRDGDLEKTRDLVTKLGYNHLHQPPIPEGIPALPVKRVEF